MHWALTTHDPRCMPAVFTSGATGCQVWTKNIPKNYCLFRTRDQSTSRVRKDIWATQSTYFASTHSNLSAMLLRLSTVFANHCSFNCFPISKCTTLRSTCSLLRSFIPLEQYRLTVDLYMPKVFLSTFLGKVLLDGSHSPYLACCKCIVHLHPGTLDLE
jgi:hypothetical protein